MCYNSFMSIITFTKGSDCSYWKGYWIATSARIIVGNSGGKTTTNKYPHDPFPSVSDIEGGKLLAYFQTIFVEYNFYTCVRDVENQEIWCNRVLWGIKFKDDADEAAFILQVNDGIEI